MPKKPRQQNGQYIEKPVISCIFVQDMRNTNKFSQLLPERIKNFIQKLSNTVLFKKIFAKQKEERCVVTIDMRILKKEMKKAMSEYAKTAVLDLRKKQTTANITDMRKKQLVANVVDMRQKTFKIKAIDMRKQHNKPIDCRNNSKKNQYTQKQSLNNNLLKKISKYCEKNSRLKIKL